jgi:hypothetical protein
MLFIFEGKYEPEVIAACSSWANVPEILRAFREEQDYLSTEGDFSYIEADIDTYIGLEKQPQPFPPGVLD